jgi:hypothetical protein
MWGSIAAVSVVAMISFCVSALSFRRRSSSDVARDWAGSYVISIKRLRELAGKSLTMPVTLRLAAPMPRLIDDDDR